MFKVVLYQYQTQKWYQKNSKLLYKYRIKINLNSLFQMRFIE